jgi:glutathione S-transferase
MKLYSVEVSGNCYKIRLLLSLLEIDQEIDCEIVPIDIAKKEHKSPAYLKKNPLGEIPALEDGAHVLRDSQAILVYLAKKYGNDDWLPNNAKEMALVMQWLSTACNEIARGPMDARAHYKFKLDIDIEKAHEKSKSILTVIENHLADREWLELNHPTIADIACFPYIALSYEGKISLDPYPNIQKWIENIKKLPNFISMPGLN